MTLQTQLADLTRQKKAATNELHRTYIRTKRDVKRAVSVDRMIRRHLGASLGVAAVAGLLLAPAPSRRGRAAAVAGGAKPGKGKSKKLKWALGLVRHFVPQAEAFIPGLKEDKEEADSKQEEQREEAAEAAPKKKKRRSLGSIIAPLVLDMVAMLVKNVNFQALLSSWTGRGKPVQEEDWGWEGAEGGVPEETRAPDEESPPTAAV